MARARRDHGGGTTDLRDLLTRWGDRVEADLQQFYGLDLGQMVAEGRFRRLLNLIVQLPADSRMGRSWDQVRKFYVLRDGMARHTAQAGGTDGG